MASLEAMPSQGQVLFRAMGSKERCWCLYTLKVFLFATFHMVPAPPASYSFRGLSTPKVLPVSTPYSQMLSASTSTCSQPF